VAEMIKILYVDAEPKRLVAFRHLFGDDKDCEIYTADSGAKGLEILQKEKDLRLVVSAQQLSDMNGFELLGKISSSQAGPFRLLLSEELDSPVLTTAINLGQIQNFHSQPWKGEELKMVIIAALQQQELLRENQRLILELQKRDCQLRQTQENFEKLINHRTETLEIRNQVLQIAQGVLDVLPVVVFGIDPEQMIAYCNESARDLYPHGGIGPLGKDRHDIFPPEINALIDRLEAETVAKSLVKIRSISFRVEVKRLHDSLSQGVVLVLIPE